MNDELKAAIKRLEDGTQSTTDLDVLRQALRGGQITIDTNERSASLRDANNNIIFTGDVNVLPQVFLEELKRLIDPPRATTPQEIAALASSRLYSLPSDIADFTGRKREVSELRKALEHDNGRVVISAINGMGGVGKTTLAVHVAHQLAERYPEAQIVVDMQGTSQPLAPIDAMMRVIRAFHPETRPADDVNQVAQAYRHVLADKRVLILLDNAADAAQVRSLEPPASCALIVTSRRRIKLEGSRLLDLDALSEKDARALLHEILDKRRAASQQLDRIAELCGRLPLALRIAGTFLAVHSDWPVDEYIEALGDERRRLAHLKLDDFDVEATLGLSDRQLEQENAELAARWRRLAVFPASFNRAAAAAVWDVAIEEARDSLSNLFERGLILYNQETTRYRLHDLVRLFVEAQLDETTRSLTRLRHAAHYCDELGKANALYLQGGEALKQGLVLFDLEWRNIRAGQTWAAACAAEENQAAELCNRFPLAGAYLLDLRQHRRESIEWIKSALIAARQLKQRGDEGAHLGNLGIAYKNLGEPRRAIEFYEQALVIDREIGDRRGEGADLGNLGIAYKNLGEPRRAIEFYEQHLAIAREIGDRRGEGNALGNLGLAYAALGETRRAIEYHEQNLAIAREIGNRRSEGAALGNLGLAYAALGETRRAIEFYEQALVIDREIGDRRGEGNATGNLGNAYAALGETRRAIEFYEQRLVIAREIGDRRGEGNALFNMSFALDQLGEREQAILNIEAALQIFEQIESPYAESARTQLAEWRGQQEA